MMSNWIQRTNVNEVLGFPNHLNICHHLSSAALRFGTIRSSHRRSECCVLLIRQGSMGRHSERPVHGMSQKATLSHWDLFR
jgi:hypothetical protein